MLHWLAGQRQPDRDDNDNVFVEPPETPAPIFAVRAFKHAIFGTPSSVAPPRPRRNSNVEKEAPRVVGRPTRPVLNRPKSANDAGMVSRIEDFPASPTKGILLTPGTVGGRGKTVTFGDHVAEKETATMSTSPERSRKTLEAMSPLIDTKGKKEVSPDRAPRRQRPQPTNKDARCCDGEVQIEDLVSISEKEPDCPVGKYWKHEYDIYRENTSREVRKLITKQKAAKSYAREKDQQCAALSEELQHERAKVGRLEKRATELESKMKELQAQLAAAQATNTSSQSTTVGTASGTRDPLWVSKRASTTDMMNTTAARDDISFVKKDYIEKRQTPSIDPQPDTGRRPHLKTRHDSLDPDTSAAPLAELVTAKRQRVCESKEDLPPESATSSVTRSETVSDTTEQKVIVNKAGTIIPPDRVAAARARLAARRQQRNAT